MKSELLDLGRAALIALGWRQGNGFCCNVSPSKKKLGWHCPECACPDTDDLECSCTSDPEECDNYVADCAHPHERCCQASTIEISEPMFLEWCDKNGYDFGMWRNVKDRTEIILFPKTDDESEEGYALCEVSGSTPSEARARAIVEASK